MLGLINGNVSVSNKVKRYIVVGDPFNILVDRSDTGGQYIIAESVTNPGGGMPLLHSHPSYETFYILAGQYEFYRQDEQGNKVAIPATAGDVVHVPGNAPHGFTNVGKEPGRVLIIIDGSGKMDDFFAEIGIPVEDENNLPVVDGPPDMEALLTVCARYGIEFLEVPPA